MSTEPLYIDLLITDGDFTLDSGSEPPRGISALILLPVIADG